MTYNRETAIEAIKRNNKRQSEKKDVVFQSAKEKRERMSRVYKSQTFKN